MSPVCCSGHRASVAFEALVISLESLFDCPPRGLVCRSDGSAEVRFPLYMHGDDYPVPHSQHYLHPSSYARTALKRSQSFEHWRQSPAHLKFGHQHSRMSLRTAHPRAIVWMSNGPNL